MSNKKAPGGGPVYVHDDVDPPEPRTSPENSGDVTDAGDADIDPADAPASDELAAELEAARAEAEQFKDQYIRTRAEMENVRKRAERDVESARKFALDRFANELLSVRDSLELGLQAADENKGDFDKLREGMEMTQRMLVKCMEQFGVEIIEAEGETFNPELHEAMTMQESADQPPNTVAAVLQKGYSLNGRVLRPARVVVTKAPA